MRNLKLLSEASSLGYLTFTSRISKGDTLEEIKRNHEKEKVSRFVETYNGNDIYMFDGKYFPYWGCNYGFNSLEDCKKE